MRGGCSATVTTCKNNASTNHSVTLDCPAPFCGGGGGECEADEDYIIWCHDQHYTYDEEQCFCGPSPIVIDIAGDGFDLTNAQRGVTFDINGDGSPDNLAWTAFGSDDAWLVLDRNGNGTIDTGAELFGASPRSPPQTILTAF